ncbi:MAG: biopolymer transporter ExbD [Phycisphaeraceae bacterium]|nr:biopolymer transporter ExbD [Phycisphaeraceae bacterium]
MRRRRATGEAKGHPNLTPMIDVVMCLIIFYLLVGQMASDQRSALALPRSGTGDDHADALAAFVNVRLDGNTLALDVDGVPVSLDQLGRAIRAAPSVHLRADAALTYERLWPVLDELARSGVRAVRVAAEQSTGAFGEF